MQASDFLNALKKNPLGMLAMYTINLNGTLQFLRAQKGQTPFTGTNHLVVQYSEFGPKKTYQLTIKSQQEAGSALVYYLPWEADASVYLESANASDYFFTARMTGCSLAIKRVGDDFRACHVNANEGSPQANKAVATTAYPDYTVFGPGDYQGSVAIVFGIKDGRWRFYYQDVNGSNTRNGEIVVP